MQKSIPVDHYDWLKTFAIIMVVVDHTGYFFIQNADWWSAFGRLAAPPFFFLMGYAHSRTIQIKWLWFAVILTLLDSWNNDWTWVAPNILLSLVLIRVSRPWVLSLLQRYGWPALATFIVAFAAALPITAEWVDYGSEGWLWALLGLCQCMYVESKAPSKADSTSLNQKEPERNWALMRLLACSAAAVVYIWQEQAVFLFSQSQLAVVILGIGVLSMSFCVFRRGPSRFQPPEAIGYGLRFLGRHTLEIYFIQLAGSELIIRLLPDLAA